MTYTVIFDDKAIAFLAKLPQELKQRIYNKILTTKEEPFHFFERLEGRKDCKLRIGDYRVVADINQKSHRIMVTLVGHRKNIYKQLEKESK